MRPHLFRVGKPIHLLAYMIPACFVIGLLAASSPIGLAAAWGAALLILWGYVSPRSFVPFCLTALALLPTFYRFKAPGIPVMLDPAFLFACVAVIALLSGKTMMRHQPKSTWIAPALLLAAGRLVALSAAAPAGSSVWRMGAQAVLWPSICLLLGWLAVRRSGADSLIDGLLLATVVVGVLGVLEATTGTNLWLDVGRAFVTEPQWLIRVVRLGHIRISGAFSHPIAFGLFCVSVVPLALMRWVGEPRKRWLASAALTSGIAGAVLSYSRGPWVALIAVVLLVFGGRTALNAVRKPAMLIAAMVGVVGVTIWWSLGGGDSLLTSVGLTGGGVDAANAAYRIRLLLAAGSLMPTVWLFGSGGQEVSGALGSFVSVDNEYLYEVINYGLIGLITWVIAVFGPVLSGAMDLLRKDLWSRDFLKGPLLVALLVSLVGYASVASFGVGSGFVLVVAGACWGMVEEGRTPEGIVP